MQNVNSFKSVKHLFLFLLLSTLSCSHLNAYEEYAGVYKWKKETPSYNPGGNDFEKDSALVKEYNKKKIKEKKLASKSQLSSSNKVNKTTQFQKRNSFSMISKDGIDIASLEGAKIIVPNKDKKKSNDKKNQKPSQENKFSYFANKINSIKPKDSNTKNNQIKIIKESKNNLEYKSKLKKKKNVNLIDNDKIYLVDSERVEKNIKAPILPNSERYAQKRVVELNKNKFALQDSSKSHYHYSRSKKLNEKSNRLEFYRFIKNNSSKEKSIEIRNIKYQKKNNTNDFREKNPRQRDKRKKSISKKSMHLYLDKDFSSNKNLRNDNDKIIDINYYKDKKLSSIKVRRNDNYAAIKGCAFMHLGIGYYENVLDKEDFIKAVKKSERLVIIS